MFAIIKSLFHMLFSIVVAAGLLCCVYLAFRKAACADSVWDLIRALIPDSPFTFKGIVLQLLYDYFIGIPAISWCVVISICLCFSNRVKPEGKEQKKA